VHRNSTVHLQAGVLACQLQNSRKRQLLLRKTLLHRLWSMWQITQLQMITF